MWRWVASHLLPVCTLAMILGSLVGSGGSAEAQSARDITLVNLEYAGTKLFVPGPVVVKKGETVKLKVINNINSEPLVHGLTIEAYRVQEVVTEGKPIIVEFKADQAGIFPIICHLHPVHVGTELVVLE